MEDAMVRLTGRLVSNPKILYKDKVFKDDQLAFVDANFFRKYIFTLPMIEGDVAKTALLQPHTQW